MTGTSRRPLLVTGLPRSGTSWVGKMLEASGDVVYVNEPLNPRHPPGRSPGVLAADVTHQFQYICPDNEQPWLSAFAGTLALRYRIGAELRRNHRPYDLARAAKYLCSFAAGRLRGRRPMLDDPYAVLSAAWFAERLGCEVLVLVRDPVAFVASWRRLGWTIDLRELLGQPLLVRDLLGPYVEEMHELVADPDDIAAAALLWRMTYTVIDDMRLRVPRIHLRRYEDLAREPVERFRELSAELGLTWSAATTRRVAAATTGRKGAGGTPHPWSLRGGLSRTAFRPMDSRASLSSYQERLTADEIDRIRELVADTAPTLYDT